MIVLLLAMLVVHDELADAIKKLRAAADLTARYQAEYDLGKILTPKALPIVLKEIDAGPAELRAHFIRAIRTVGGKEAIAALRGLVGRYEMIARAEAAYALKLLGDDDGMKALVAEVQKPALSKEDRLTILDHLYSYYYAAADVPAVLRKVILAEKDADVRKRAVLALVSHKDPESIPFLRKIAEDEVDPLRFEALCALIKLGDSDAIDRGLTALEKGGLATQALYDIIFALRLAGGRDIAARLRVLLEKAKDANVKMQLISVLAQLKDTRTIALLIKLVNDANASVAEAAIRALVDLGGKSQIDLLRKFLKHETLTIRLTAAESLVALDDPSGIPVLRDSLSDKSSYYRQRAATALGVLRVPDVVPPLILAIGDEDANVRTTASTALIGALRQLYPYRRFDYADVGYDPKATDAAARAKAIERIKEWWEKNKP